MNIGQTSRRHFCRVREHKKSSPVESNFCLRQKALTMKNKKIIRVYYNHFNILMKLEALHLIQKMNTGHVTY